MGIFETAGGLFDQAADIAAGVARQAGDIVSTTSIRAQIFEKNAEYDRLMKELGDTVYDRVKDDPAIVELNPGLFTRIAGVAEARQMLQDRLAETQAATDAAAPIDVEPLDDKPSPVDAVKENFAKIVEEAKERNAAKGAGGTEGATAQPDADGQAAADVPRQDAPATLKGYRSATNAAVYGEDA